MRDKNIEQFPQQTLETPIDPENKSSFEQSTYLSLGQRIVDNAREGLALVAATTAIGGALVAEAVAGGPAAEKSQANQSTPLMLEAGSPEALKKQREIARKCNAGYLSVNQAAGGMTAPGNSKIKTLSISNINGGKRQKFSWTHSSNLKVCGIVASRSDNKVMFAKPTKARTKNGYYIDPSPLYRRETIGTCTVYFSKKK